MENASLSSDLCNDVTTSQSTSDDLLNLVFKIINIIIGTVGVLDNLFVLIIFILFIKISQKAINILIVNQSIIDMCASFLTLLVAIFEVDATRMLVLRDSVYDQFVCRIWVARATLWGFLLTSTYGIVVTAFERYFAVICPVWYNLNVKKRIVRRSVVITIWIVIPGFCTIMSCVTSDIVDGVCVPWGVYASLAMQKIVIFMLVFVAYLLPLALMLFCYSSIVYSLRTKVNSTSRSSLSAAGRNSVVTSLMICFGFVACWSPTAIYNFLLLSGYFTKIGGWFYQFVMTLAFVNSCVNPFIYAAKYREFKTGVRRMMHRQVQPAVQTVEMQVAEAGH